MKKYLLLWLAVLVIVESGAQLDKSSSIQDFTLKNATDGKQFSLSNYHNSTGVVVIFTSNYCPYSKLYEDRIIDLADKYRKTGVNFILINPNNPAKSSVEGVRKMAEKAHSKSFDFPYLSDSDQKVADMFGAEKTPEAFLLIKDDHTFKIVYKGAIDDNPQIPSDVSEHYLQDAIEKILNGKSLAFNTKRPTGCMIKR